MSVYIYIDNELQIKTCLAETPDSEDQQLLVSSERKREVHCTCQPFENVEDGVQLWSSLLTTQLVNYTPHNNVYRNQLLLHDGFIKKITDINNKQQNSYSICCISPVS